MADAQAPKEKWKMARYRPNMDFAKVMFIFVWYFFENMLKYQAKNVIGLPSGAKAEELEHEEIHKQFITKLAQVTPLFRRTLKIFNVSMKASLPNSKVDPRLLHEAYQLLVKLTKNAPKN